MRFEMIENFSVPFSFLKFSFCMAAIISAPTPFKRLWNFALYFLSRKNAVGTTKIFYPPTYPKEKILWTTTRKIIPSLFMPKKRSGYNQKNLSPHFSWQKLMRLSAWKTKNLQDVQISARGITRKKKAGKGLWYPLPAAVNILETETESCDPVSDYLTLLRF